jgi:glutamate/aspartate transport system substrate-binding protein
MTKRARAGQRPWPPEAGEDIVPIPRKPSARGWAVALVAGLFLAPVPPAFAQPLDEPAARALSGTLKRIKEAGVVRLGYREGAVPFSYAGPDGKPIGYSIDLCLAIVSDIAEAVGATRLRVEYRRVTPEDRFTQVAAGSVDLECGTSTNTAARRESVAFSPVIFVAGTRLLVKRGGPVRSARDLPGRQVAVVRGTTNEEAMRKLAAAPGRSFGIVVAGDYEAAIAKVAAGEADALAADDVLLAGFLAGKGRRAPFAMVGGLLSLERYGIAFAKGDAFLADAVAAGFRRLATTRELRWTYDRWFLRTLPTGERLGLPMSVELQRSFEVLGLPAS